jgi:hypothetical protein
VFGIALAVLAALLGVTGARMAHQYDVLRHCTDCAPFGLMESFRLPRILVNLSVAVPLVLGVFLGATVMTREMEQSTHVLAWTQSVSRRRWLASKLAVVFALTLVLAAAMSALVTWWSGPLNGLMDFRFEGLQFDTQNLAPIAYSVFAVALGFAAGAVLRRTLPAVGVTIAGFLVVRLFVELSLRPHFAAVEHGTESMFAPTVRAAGAWMLQSDLVDGAGRVVHGPFRLPDVCRSAVDRAGADRCLGNLGYHIETTFHPASRYWPFQWAEAAIFVALAAVLVTIGYLAVTRRDA